MKIAIVDDRAEDRALMRGRLEQELPARGMRFELVEFDSGEAFTEAFSPGRFAVVFLDMYMGEMGGVEVGDMLSRDDPECKIVLLTSSRDFLQESYDMGAAYYLIKPYSMERLRRALDFCFPEPDPNDILLVHTKEGAAVVARPEILYIEMLGRYPQVHLKNRAVESIDSFSDVVRPLEKDERFFCCCRGVVVQLRYIKAMENNDFVMQNGQRVPISRRLKPQAAQAFYSLALARTPGEDEG